MRLSRCNGEVELGSKALDDVLYRAQLELFPEALLVGAKISFSATTTSPVTMFVFVCVSVSEREREHVIRTHMLACGFDSYVAHYAVLCWSVCQRLQAECNPTRLFTCFPLCPVKL